MSDLDRDLDDLGPVPGIRSFVETLAEDPGVTSDRKSDYVSLRPATGGAIAVYVHRSSLSIACRPADAAAAVRLVPGLRVEHRDATVYLHADADVLEADRSAVRTLAAEALSWRTAWADTTSGGGGATAAAPRAPSCPVCFLTALPEGRCHE